MQSSVLPTATQMITPSKNREEDQGKPIQEELKTGETLNETPMNANSELCSSEELRSDSSSDSSFKRAIFRRTQIAQQNGLTLATLNLDPITNFRDEETDSLVIQSQTDPDSDSGLSTESSVERMPFKFKIIGKKSLTHERKLEQLEVVCKKTLTHKKRSENTLTEQAETLGEQPAAK